VCSSVPQLCFLNCVSSSFPPFFPFPPPLSAATSTKTRRSPCAAPPASTCSRSAASPSRCGGAVSPSTSTLWILRRRWRSRAGVRLRRSSRLEWGVWERSTGERGGKEGGAAPKATEWSRRPQVERGCGGAAMSALIYAVETFTSTSTSTNFFPPSFLPSFSFLFSFLLPLQQTKPEPRPRALPRQSAKATTSPASRTLSSATSSQGSRSRTSSARTATTRSAYTSSFVRRASLEQRGERERWRSGRWPWRWEWERFLTFGGEEGGKQGRRGWKRKRRN